MLLYWFSSSVCHILSCTGYISACGYGYNQHARYAKQHSESNFHFIRRSICQLLLTAKYRGNSDMLKVNDDSFLGFQVENLSQL